MQKPQFGRWRDVVVLGTVKGMGNVNALLKLNANYQQDFFIIPELSNVKLLELSHEQADSCG